MLFKVWGVENELREKVWKSRVPLCWPILGLRQGSTSNTVQELNERKCHATPQFVWVAETGCSFSLSLCLHDDAMCCLVASSAPHSTPPTKIQNSQNCGSCIGRELPRDARLSACLALVFWSAAMRGHRLIQQRYIGGLVSKREPRDLLLLV